MNEQKIIIESLSMDLKRIALGLHRKSLAMAQRFKKEAVKREKELEETELDNYLKILIKKTKAVLQRNDEKVAEDALMYSTLLQNYVRSYPSSSLRY